MGLSVTRESEKRRFKPQPTLGGFQTPNLTSTGECLQIENGVKIWVSDLFIYLFAFLRVD